MKRIIIKNENEKKWIRILSLDKSSYNLKETCIINSFDELQNEFKTRQNPLPKFVLESKKKEKISSIEEFFNTNEDTFIVTFELENEADLNGSSKLINNEVNLIVLITHLNHKRLWISIFFKETVKTLKSKIAEKLSAGCSKIIQKVTHL